MSVSAAIGSTLRRPSVPKSPTQYRAAVPPSRHYFGKLADVRGKMRSSCPYRASKTHPSLLLTVSLDNHMILQDVSMRRFDSILTQSYYSR